MRRSELRAFIIAAVLLASSAVGMSQERRSEEPPRETSPEEAAPSIEPPSEVDEESPSDVSVVDLGDGRYRIRAISVDKENRRFTVSGKILRNEPPLEFLAVTLDGFKGYEALVMLDATAYEFNTACLLIGLDPDRGRPAAGHFDPAPVLGDPVEIRISWEKDGTTTRMHAADLVQLDGETMPRSDWVYTGSTFTPDGQFMAAIDGTLVGFVHDPSSVIEHRAGFGIDRWGEVKPNVALMPPLDTPVTLTIEHRNDQRTPGS